MEQRAAIYARVNTSEKVEGMDSLAGQIESGRSVAQEKGFKVVGIYQDKESGMKPLINRPGGSRLSLAIDSLQIDVVIVSGVDRLSRDVVNLVTTLLDWSQRGVEIYSLETELIDIELAPKPKDPSNERPRSRYSYLASLIDAFEATRKERVRRKRPS